MANTVVGSNALAVAPVTLEGRSVRLEPLTEAHTAELSVAAQDEEIWRYMPSRLWTENEIRSWMADVLADQAAGTALPFAIVERGSRRAIGSTRYLDIRARDRGLEIGWTWLGRDYWRTPINTECKYLLLGHAFETLGCIRVQLKTHRLNFRSRRAIERIGAQFEGILRQQVVLPNGTYRDSAYYSLIDGEWPAVKIHLEHKLAGGGE